MAEKGEMEELLFKGVRMPPKIGSLHLQIGNLGNRYLLDPVPQFWEIIINLVEDFKKRKLDEDDRKEVERVSQSLREGLVQVRRMQDFLKRRNP